MNKQFQLYSIDTKSFYNSKEEEINKRLTWIQIRLKIIKEYTLYNYLQQLEPDNKEYKKYSFKNAYDYYKQQRKPRIKKNENSEYVAIPEQKKQLAKSKYLRRFINKLMKKNKDILKSEEFNNLLKENKTYKKYEGHEKGEKSRLEELKTKLSDLLPENKEIRELNPDKISKYNIISMFDSSLSRILTLEPDKTTTDIFIVRIFHYEVLKQLLKDGFNFKQEHYIFFTASAGQIRKKKIMMIKESVLKEYWNTLTCGLSVEDINNSNENGCSINKYLSYLALLTSATDEWKNFDIAKAIVIPDFETVLKDRKVDYIAKVAGEVKVKRKKKNKKKKNKDDETTKEETVKVWKLKAPETKTMDIPINHSDGCGWILPSESKKNFQFRMPWFKGLLTPANYLQWCKEYNNGNYKIKDIYGKQWDLLKDDIRYVFTKSQFKMHKYYPNIVDEQDNIIKYGWDTYKENFKTYDCKANICNEEPDEFEKKTFSYQLWQTLTDIKDEEIKQFTDKIDEFVTKTYTDIITMLEVLGVTDDNKKKNYIKQALEIYPELLQDPYIKEQLSSMLNSTKKEAKYGRFEIDAKYTFIIPDIFSWMQYSIGGVEDPEGLLKDGEVSCRLYEDKPKLLVDRSPHLWKEHAVRKNVIDESFKDWFVTDGVYTSCHDLISKILQFDVDGDTAVVVGEDSLIDIAERNMKDVLPLYYEMDKAAPELINADNIYKSLTSAFKYSNIGSYSNKITSLWNSDNINKTILKVIKILVAQNNFSIDAAKTLEMPVLDEDINKEINQIKKDKMPYFFQFRKDGYKNKVEKNNNSTVNRICKNIEAIKQGDFDFSGIGKFNYTMLMNNPKIKINNDIIKKYEELNKEKDKFFYKNDLPKEQIASAVWKIIEREFCECYMKNSIDFVDATDMVIKHIYKNKSDCNKAFLFNTCGDVIIQNLKDNIDKSLYEGHIICTCCGKKTAKKNNRQTMCESCADKKRKEKDRSRKKKIPHLEKMNNVS